ncbi:MAG: AraC-like DNA-binding protein [Saprospiraceae bacterium]|jgi:AraC-like DNA-binding protein
MKVLPFKIPQSEERSFRVQIDELPHFYDRFHHHPELQITLIEKSHGTLLIGNSISSFQEGDLFVIGANVPHSFRNQESFYTSKQLTAKSISIFFNKNSLGEGFFSLPELKKVNAILKEADKGIRISGAANNFILSKIRAIESEKGVQRVLTFLEILAQISTSDGIELLSSIGFSLNPATLESKKLEAIFQYILDHYEQPIRLEKVANIANLSISAFCRFFKTRTRKTFSKFVNEFRVSVACKELMAGNHSISEICYQVGFTNLSNFNRQFKEITGFSPSGYVNIHQ